MIPIQIILYKSQDKIPNLVKGLNLLNFPKEKFKVFFLNNNPDDSLNEVKKQKPEFQYEYWNNPDGNTGFGRGHNQLFKKYSEKSEYFLISNPDVIHFPELLSQLVEVAQKTLDAMLIEPAQFPVEHEYEFDRKTLERNWCTAACVLVKTEGYKKLGGFDENIFMYCEDLDLSFRAWLNNYKCLYVPYAKVLHITQHFDPEKNLETEYYYTRLNTLYILRKYFREEDVKRYINENIDKLDDKIQKKILTDFNKIKNYDKSVREKLPNSRIVLYDDFTYAPKRWHI